MIMDHRITSLSSTASIVQIHQRCCKASDSHISFQLFTSLHSFLSSFFSIFRSYFLYLFPIHHYSYRSPFNHLLSALFLPLFEGFYSLLSSCFSTSYLYSLANHVFSIVLFLRLSFCQFYGLSSFVS